MINLKLFIDKNDINFDREPFSNYSNQESNKNIFDDKYIESPKKCDYENLFDDIHDDILDDISDTELDDDAKQNKENYINHMNSIVDKIKSINWGETIEVKSEHTDNYLSNNCSITKNIRYDTYVFNGYGSKNILKYFINKTKVDKEYKYQKIIQILDSKSNRRFLPIKCWKKFWLTYKDEPLKCRHLFELIRSDQPCKPYLDIEWTETVLKDNYNAFIEKLQNDLITIFNERYKLKLDKNDIMISQSHSSTKVSFHVVIDKTINDKTVAFRTNRKGYPESAWDLWTTLIEYDKSYASVIDGSVYTTDREFRVIFSNKTNEFRPVLPYNSKKIRENTLVRMKTDDCLRHIITYSESNEYHFINTPEISKKYLVVNKKYYDTSIPITITNKKMNELMELIKPIHPTAKYTGRTSCGNGWRFSYENKNEKCYTGNFHESNGFYVFEKPECNIIYMKCMSDNCKGTFTLGGKQKNTKKLF